MHSDRDMVRNSGPTIALSRPLYEPGHYLASSDLHTEQGYLLQRLRRHNRYLHGWGVICGLWVAPAREPRRPWEVLVCPGYAIGPYGDEIFVPRRAPLDICDSVWLRTVILRRPAPIAYVAIRYAEFATRPAPTNPPSCGCHDPMYVPSRIRDDFKVDVLWSLPERGVPDPFDPCSDSEPRCPKCPESPYVILASVILPASEADQISLQDIDNTTFRAQI